MKILYVNSFYRPDVGGGAELMLESIIEGLAARGHQAIVLATTDKAGLSIETIGSAKIYRARIQNFYWQFRKDLPGKLVRALWHWRDRENAAMGKVFRKVMNSELPDLVVFHNLAGHSIAVWHEAFKLGVPTIQVVHDQYLICPATMTFKNGKACTSQCVECFWFRRKHVSASAKLSMVIGVSHFVLRRLKGEGYFHDVKHKVIHNAVTIGEPRVREKKSNSDKLIFGYIGSIIPAKGPEWLIKQFRLYGCGAKLLIAGQGSKAFLNHLANLAKGAEIEFLGYTKNVDFFRRIDVAIVPSIWPDTLPGVAYEALAHHVPVIASKQGGLPEIIVEGSNGLLCDPLDENSLGFAIKRVLEDRELLNVMALNARESIKEFLNYDVMIKNYEDAYYNLLNCSPSVS